MKFFSFINVKAGKMRENELCPSILNINLAGYRFSYIFNDIFVGLKTFFTILPIAISFAIFSGGSPIQGIISVGVTAIVSIFIGGSKYQISSVAWAISVISIDIFAKYQYKGMLLTSAIVALILIVCGNIRVGNLLKYISKTFLAAIAVYTALVIIVTQTQVLLNIPITYSYQNFHGNCVALFSRIKNVDTQALYTYLISMGSFALLKLFFKGFSVYIIYIICWFIVIWCNVWNIFTLPDILSSLKTIGQSFFQDLNRSTIFNISYSFSFSQSVYGNLALLSSAISLVIACQVCSSTGITKSLTGETRVQTNMELISTGVANFASVATGGLFVAPDIDVTMQNIRDKSKSIVTLLILVSAMGTLLYLKDYVFKYIPAFAVSTILIYMSFHILYQYSSLKYLNVTKTDSQIFLLILFVALEFGLVPAIFIGFIISLMHFANRMICINEASVNTKHLRNSSVAEFLANKYGYISTKKIPNNTLKKIEVIQFENVLDVNLIEYISDVFIVCNQFPKVVIIYFKNVPFFDSFAMEMLRKFVKTASKYHSMVIVSGSNGLLLDILKRKSKEYNSADVFGCVVPDFSDAVRKTLYKLSSKQHCSSDK